VTDRLQRFMLRGAAVRGEIVSLDSAWSEIVQRHDLPSSVRDRLGELAAAALLLSATLKFDGKLILQIHGDGPVTLFVVECDVSGSFRATVKLREGASIAPDADLAALVNAHGRGRFVVTLDPSGKSPNRQAYQSIVPFEGRSVAAVLERYMQRSEQIPTRLWLAADGRRAAGLLLQQLPAEGGHDAVVEDGELADADGWNRLGKLAETLGQREMLDLTSNNVLKRLFWQEHLHAFDERSCRFSCSCSREKVSAMLKMLGKGEIDQILAERSDVEVHCDFCNRPYVFDAVDCTAMFSAAVTPPGSAARH
jgi:molecular chaperone Hsp33